MDIISRHRWLMEIGKPKLEMLKTDPFWCDPQIAAFYLYGMACYVGAGFCTGDAYKNQQLKIPKVSNEGIFRSELNGDIDKIKEYFKSIQYRMRNTKIACGEWDRVLTPIWTTGNQDEHIAGIFLDSPYQDSEHSVTYSAGGGVAQAVRRWAIENGSNPNMRIIVAGYESAGYTFPSDWFTIEWKAGGGYGNQSDGKGRENAKRERLWCSPHCIQNTLFSLIDSDVPDIKDTNSQSIICTSNGEETDICDPPTTHVLPEDDIKVHITSGSNTHALPVSVLSKETKQQTIKPKYAQMSIFDLMNEEEGHGHPDH